jgi:hypothetical protein
VYGDRVVGEADVPDFTQASLWTYTQGSWSWTNLHPDWADWSVANAVYGDQVGGEVYTSADDFRQASLWTLSEGSWVWSSLSPAGATGSSVHGVYDGWQVGDAWVDNIERASLWQGTPRSWKDLHPPYAGATASMAASVYGTWQVGSVTVDGQNRASLWKGTPESWINLHVYLRSDFGGDSNAYGVWSDGSFIYVVGSAKCIQGSTEAVMWVIPYDLTDVDESSPAARTVWLRNPIPSILRCSCSSTSSGMDTSTLEYSIWQAEGSPTS